MVPAFIEEEQTEPTVVGSIEIPICEDCDSVIHARDVRDYQLEAGVSNALPRCCTNCAEAV
jgi:hypothetical protein